MTTKSTKKQTIGPITVEVTAIDIKRGRTGNAQDCAIARAIKRLKFKNVSVGGTVSLTKGSGKNALRLVFGLPKWAVTFIDNFDTGKHVKPFTFTLRKLVAIIPATA